MNAKIEKLQAELRTAFEIGDPPSAVQRAHLFLEATQSRVDDYSHGLFWMELRAACAKRDSQALETFMAHATNPERKPGVSVVFSGFTTLAPTKTASVIAFPGQTIPEPEF